MRAYTLIELLFVLLLVGVTAASFAPVARRWRDRAAVLGARESLVGLLAEARLTAVETGAASLRIVEEPPSAKVLTPDSTLRSVSLGSEFGVELALSGASSQVELRYDALGVGRMASQTVVFGRGKESAGLVVSSYGRVRRQ